MATINLHTDPAFSKAFDELNEAEKKWVMNEANKAINQFYDSKWSNDALAYVVNHLQRNLDSRKRPGRVRPHALDVKKEPSAQEAFAKLFAELK